MLIDFSYYPVGRYLSDKHKNYLMIYNRLNGHQGMCEMLYETNDLELVVDSAAFQSYIIRSTFNLLKDYG